MARGVFVRSRRPWLPAGRAIPKWHLPFHLSNTRTWREGPKKPKIFTVHSFVDLPAGSHDGVGSPFGRGALDQAFAILGRAGADHPDAVLAQTGDLKVTASLGQQSGAVDATGTRTTSVQQDEQQPLSRAREATPASVDGLFRDLLGDLFR